MTRTDPATTPRRLGGQPRGQGVERGSVDRRAVDDVALAYVQIAWSSDTRTDQSPAAAAERAGWLTSARMQQAQASADAHATTPEWQTWRAHDAYTQARATANLDDGRPSDTTDRVVRSYLLTVTTHGRAGWRATAQHLVVYLALQAVNGRWAVDDLRVVPA